MVMLTAECVLHASVYPSHLLHMSIMIILCYILMLWCTQVKLLLRHVPEDFITQSSSLTASRVRFLTFST